MKIASIIHLPNVSHSVAFSVALLLTACSAKLETPAQVIGQLDPGTTNAAPKPAPTPTPNTSTDLNATGIYLREYTNPFATVQLKILSGSSKQIEVTRTCSMSAEFCLQFGLLDREVFILEMNKSDSSYERKFPDGSNRVSRLTASQESAVLITLHDEGSPVQSKVSRTETLSMKARPCDEDDAPGGLEVKSIVVRKSGETEVTEEACVAFK